MSVIHRAEPERRSRRRPRDLPRAPMPRWVVLGADAVLSEVGSPLGLALWQRLQDVELWAQAAPEARRDLFQEQDRQDALPAFSVDAGPQRQLNNALRVFGSLVVFPDRVDTTQVVHACLRVAEWASEAGHEMTGEYFTELAALVQPQNAELARYAGRVARRRADFDRGIRWYRRSLVLAHIASDFEAKALAYLWWGTLEEQRGNGTRARELYNKGLRIAKRKRLQHTAASAQHDLLALCELGMDLEEGMAHAAAALQGYEADEPRLPALAHDLAVLWVMHGFHEEAQQLFEAALPHIHQRHERIQIVSSIARASAAIRDVERFYAAWEEVQAYAAKFTEAAAAALINVARGARTFRKEALATELLQQSIQIARRRGEPVVERIAQAVLDDREPVDEKRPPPPAVADLLQRVLQRLHEFAPPN